MKKLLKKRLQNEKGLTLVELLAVIVILGIIAAIAIPSIGGIIEKSRINAAIAEGQTVLSAANLYFVENQAASTASLEQLTEGNFMDDVGTLKTGIVVTKVVSTKTIPGENTLAGTAVTKGGKTVTFNNATNKKLSDKDKDSYTVSD